MIHRLALPIIAAVLAGCMHGPANTAPVNTAWMGPRDQMALDFIPDQAPLEPPHTRDLQKYILTLPVFEMTPKRCKQSHASTTIFSQ